jgi:hypothetical protein
VRLAPALLTPTLEKSMHDLEAALAVLYEAATEVHEDSGRGRITT